MVKEKETMEKVINELLQIVDEYSKKFKKLNEEELQSRPSPTKWSKKEVLGHLIDSGHNNLRRFVCGQYESIPPQIVYDQDFWVIANGYHDVPSEEIIALWILINKRIASILDNMPSENFALECNTGKHNPQLHSLIWLAEDYVKHLKHHLNQIIPNSFDVVYP